MTRTARTRLFLAGIAVAALALRVGLVVTLRWDSPDGDEAVWGLIAKHIATGRELPVFHYGQSYFGTLEAYFLAGVFRVVGFRPNAIFLIPLLAGLGAVALAGELARRYVTGRIALLSVLVLAVCSATWQRDTLDAGNGLALCLQLGAVLSLMIAVSTDSARIRGSDLGFFGLSGLAVWSWQLYIPAFVLLCIVWARYRGSRLGTRAWLICAGVFFGASSPFWSYHIGLSGTRVGDLLTKTGTGAGVPVARWLRVKIFGAGGGNLFLSAIALVGLARGTWMLSRDRATGCRAALVVLPLAVTTLLLGPEHRHMLSVPLLLTPLGLAAVERAASRLVADKSSAIPAAITVLATLYGLATIVSNRTLPWREEPAFYRHVYDWPTIVTRLDEAGFVRGYGEFWTAYPLTYMSDERILVVPVLPSRYGNVTDRYPPYYDIVRAADSVFIFRPAQMPDDPEFRELMSLSDLGRQLLTNPLDVGEGLRAYGPLPREDAVRLEIEALHDRWLGRR